MFSTSESLKRLKHASSHRNPSVDAQKTLRAIRQAVLDLQVAIDDLLPPTRERAVALTKLDEVRMWACNAATLDGVVIEELTINMPGA